jgi:hypothetical protein
MDEDSIFTEEQLAVFTPAQLAVIKDMIENSMRNLRIRLACNTDWDYGVKGVKVSADLEYYDQRDSTHMDIHSSDDSFALPEECRCSSHNDY